MRKIFDVRCTDPECGEVTEVFGRSEDPFRCGACDKPAKRIISPIRCQLEGVSGSFPGASFKWERDHIRAGKNNG